MAQDVQVVRFLFIALMTSGHYALILSAGLLVGTGIGAANTSDHDAVHDDDSIMLQSAAHRHSEETLQTDVPYTLLKKNFLCNIRTSVGWQITAEDCYQATLPYFQRGEAVVFARYASDCRRCGGTEGTYHKNWYMYSFEASQVPFVQNEVSTRCGEGTDITTESQCEDAAARLGLAWQSQVVSTADAPKYCYIQPNAYDYVYFNTHDTGKADPFTHTMLCTEASTSASAVGDPHLVNLRGEKFDLNLAGEHLLLQVPQGSGEELEVVGFVEHIPTQASGQSPCDQFLFKKFMLRGSWLDAHKGVLVIDAGEDLKLEGFGARHEKRGKIARTSYFHLLKQSTPAAVGLATVWGCKDGNSKEQRSLCKQLGSSVGAGHRQLKVFDHKSAMFVLSLRGFHSMPLHLAFSRFQGASPSYLNLALHGLSPTDAVGGLLGSDDHTEVSKQGKACNMTHHSKPRPDAQRLSELHIKNAEGKRKLQRTSHVKSTDDD